jgi:predicted RNase H-like nuclease (RuvC/YqgF family)
MKLTQEELEAIRKRAEAATPGPWGKEFRYGISIITNYGFNVIDEDGGVTKYPDAEFIAHARQDVPKLLAEIERLQKENRLLESFFEESDRNKERYASEVERLNAELEKANQSTKDIVEELFGDKIRESAKRIADELRKKVGDPE